MRPEWTKSSALKLSEKSRRACNDSLIGDQNGTFRLILAFVYGQNSRSERRPHPFSDSFFTEFSEVRSKGRSTPVSPIRLSERWLWGPRVCARPSTHRLPVERSS